MSVEWIDCEQGSPEWHETRRGIITASRFSDVLAEGKGLTRAKYMRELAGEIITGSVADSYSNAAMERGKEMEAEARAEYEFLLGHSVRQVGFARMGRVGCSPDGMIDVISSPVEFKTKLPHLMIECFERGQVLPPEHKAQVQGSMWVTGATNAVFAAYWPMMPLFVVNVPRDDEFISRLAEKVEDFLFDLDAMVDRVRCYRPKP